MSTNLPSLREAFSDFGTLPRLFDRDFDRLFDDVWGGRRLPLARAAEAFAPRIDVSETDSGLEIAAELPGLDADDVELVLDGDRLTIKGEKRVERDEDDKEKGYALRERSYGAFQRSLRLPERFDVEKVEAAYDKGVLRISVPKRPDRTKKVEIKAA